MNDISRDMKIIDYKRLFEITYDGGWSDENVWYAKCKFCNALPVFNIYAVKDWNILNSDQRKKRFYAAIKRHIKTNHPELILPKRTNILEQQEETLNRGLYFLKNFPFRPYIKEEPLKVWKPGTIVLPHSEKEKKRLVELEKDLIPLVENTDNKIFYRHLFFPSIFINNDFNFEGLIVKGIYITECYSESDSNCYTLHWPVPNDYAIFIVAADIDIGCEFYTCFAMVNKMIGENFTDTSEERSRMRRLAEYSRTLICNIIDMVEGNDEDLEVVTINTSKEQNLKRIKRKQIPMPTKVFIRAKGEFKKYVKQFIQYGNDIKKLSHRFLVRGHFRHFRSDKFIYMRGEKTWIKPFYKGEGIVISKDYVIR